MVMSTRPRGATIAGPFIHGIGDYGTPVSIPPFRRFWNFAPGGAHVGFGGLGDCVTDPDSGVTSCTDTSSTTTLATGGGYFGIPTGVTPVGTSGGGITAQQATGIAQQGFQDVFNVLKLFNPVPPGTVMQTGPGGTSFISRAQTGAATPSGISLGGGSGLLPILLIGGGLLLVMGLSKGRG